MLFYLYYGPFLLIGPWLNYILKICFFFLLFRFVLFFNLSSVELAPDGFVWHFWVFLQYGNTMVWVEQSCFWILYLWRLLYLIWLQEPQIMHFPSSTGGSHFSTTCVIIEKKKCFFFNNVVLLLEEGGNVSSLKWRKWNRKKYRLIKSEKVFFFFFLCPVQTGSKFFSFFKPLLPKRSVTFCVTNTSIYVKNTPETGLVNNSNTR